MTKQKFLCAILAAGDGSRLKSITPFKPMLELLPGERLLDFAINNLLKVGPQEILIQFNDDERSMPLEEFSFSKNLSSRSKCKIYYKSTPSSFHTLCEVLEKVDFDKCTHVLVTMVDSIVKADDLENYFAFCKTLKPNQSGLLLTSFCDDEKPLTVALDSKTQKISDFQVPLTSEPIVTSGVYCFSKEVVEFLKQAKEKNISKMRNFLKFLIDSKHEILGFVANKTIDVDRPNDLFVARNFLNKPQFKQELIQSKINTIFFDFGGCLDSDGMHSRTLFLNSFIEFCPEIVLNNTKLFQEAYSIADKKLIDQNLVLTLGLKEMNLVFINEIFSALNSLLASNCDTVFPDNVIHKLSVQISNDITIIQGNYLKRNYQTLIRLKKIYNCDLGIISNFTGNLEVILKEFDMHHLFKWILDSYHIGYSKPDLKLYQQALKLSNRLPQEILYIGDNIDRDINPAKQLSINTLLIVDKTRNDLFDFLSNYIDTKANKNFNQFIFSLEDLL